MNYKNFIHEWENEADIIDEWLFERFRIWRDRELVQSDWTQLSDAPCDQTTWANYRQALRDLPAQNADPKKIVFPQRPE